MQNLYLIKCEQFYKIGVANDVRNRLAQLATGNPFDLKVLAIYEFDNANTVEAAIHQCFSKSRFKREWFKLNTKNIETFHTICQLLGGIANTLPTLSDQDIEDAEVLADSNEKIKFDYTAMFADGWRIEPTSSNGVVDKYWCWRKGSGKNREYIYGGTIEGLPHPDLEEMRKHFSGNQ